jgi:tetratricopeptide (TPR) repeat protein
MALGQSDRAVEEFREAARLLPATYSIRYGLAMALVAAGDNAAAIPEFERAISVAPPDDPSAHLSFATSLEQLNRNPEAVREYLRYLELRPTAPDAEWLRLHVDTLRQAKP